MKNLFPLFLIICCYGCPSFDPPTGILCIHNYSDSAIYVYESCDDSLSSTGELSLFLKFYGGVDENGKPKDPIYSPNYRVNAYSYGEFAGYGTPNNPKLYCKGQDHITLFFISENTMRNHSWNEVVDRQLFEKKIRLNQTQLDSLNWKVTYTP